jgi:hypothetical protein
MKSRRAGRTLARSVDSSETSSSRHRRNMQLIGVIAFLVAARYVGLI